MRRFGPSRSRPWTPWRLKHPNYMIGVVLALVVIGILLWVVNAYVPMDGKIKQILNVFVVVCVVLWLVYMVFGSHFHDIPVPRL
jgi:bacteriorhodopsin